MQRSLLTFAAIIVGLLPALRATAHHSAAAFDQNLPVAIAGAVTNVEWTSPHARLYVDAVDDDGKTINWNFELPSPNTLMRRGWSRSSLQVGDEVEVTGIRARNHPHIAIATGVTDTNGKRLFAGSASASE